MTHKFVIELVDDYKGYEQDVDYLERIYGAEEYNGGWIPLEQEIPPQDTYILLSFFNFSLPIIGRYEEDEEGNGNFYAGDEDETLLSQDMYVNAWQPLPEQYEEY